MPEVSIRQTNWSSGEISPDIIRSDVERYYNACSKLRNFIITEKGSLQRRTGFKKLLSVDISQILIPPIIKSFTFREDVQYLLEFGENYIRVLKNNVLQNIGTDNKLTSPFTLAQIKEAQFAQSNDIIFITHKTVGIKKLNRISDTSWSFTDFDPQDGPFLDQNFDEDITVLNNVKNGTTATPGAMTAASPGGTFFTTNDVGRLIRIQHKGSWGSAKISSFTNTLLVGFINQIGYKFKNFAVQQFRWRLGAWSNYLGWPRSICFHKERLCFGGTPSYPDQLVQSVLGDYDTFSPTMQDTEIQKNNYDVKYPNPANDYSVEYDDQKHIVTPDSSIVSYLSGDAVPLIRVLKSFSQGLFVGTSAGIYVVTGGAPREAQTPETVDIRFVSTTPVSAIPPILVKNVLVFVDGSKRRIKAFEYDFGTNDYKEQELTLLSRHLFDSDIKEIIYQNKPESIVWVVLESGEFVGITYNPDEKIIACHKHFIGHEFQNNSFAKVMSLAVMNTNSGNEDKLYAVINRRDQGGSTQTNIELLSEYMAGSAHSNFYLDSYSVISSVSHPSDLSSFLYNRVGIDKIYENSIVPFDIRYGDVYPYTNVEVGFAYKSELESLPLEYLFNGQSTFGRSKKLLSFYIYFNGVLGGLLGTLTKLYPLNFARVSQIMSTVLPLAFGQKEIKFKTGNEKVQKYRYEITEPYRADILYVDAHTDVKV